MHSEEATLNTEQIIGGLIGSGIGTALVQGAVAIYQQVRTGRSHGKFLAFRIATELEAYAKRCLDRTQANRNFESSRGAMDQLHTSLQPFAQYPDDLDGWRNIDPQIVHIVYELRADHDATEHGIQWAKNEFGLDEAVDEANAHFVSFGLRALRVAKSIRQHYGFPLADGAFEEELEWEATRWPEEDDPTE